MRNSLLIGLGLGGYVVAFMAAVAYVGARQRRGQSAPTPLQFKLLRGPGETRRRQVRAFEDRLIVYTLGAAFAPLLVAALLQAVLDAVGSDAGLRPGWHFALYLAAGIGTLVLSGGWYWRRLQENGNRHLDYLAERAVAEELNKLSSQGFRIFHDVPAETGERAFNLNHVAVGPNGVYAIETNTQRKSWARPGFEEHEVVFDGKRLIWPWGESETELIQIKAQARWLYAWIQQATGLTIPIRPILAIPGWSVLERDVNSIRVLPPKLLPPAVLAHPDRQLSDDQVDLIARQLEHRCRDITD
jgi:hypothetical protein